MGGGGGGAVAVVVMVVVILLSEGTRGGNATQHVVGGSQGWDPSVDLTSWASGRTFAVGDQLGMYAKTNNADLLRKKILSSIGWMYTCTPLAILLKVSQVIVTRQPLDVHNDEDALGRMLVQILSPSSHLIASLSSPYFFLSVERYEN